MATRRKHLTKAKIQRAIDAMIEVIECEEFDRAEIHTIDHACNALREMQRRSIR